MTRPTFLGMENAPDHPPDHVPHDSPRWHDNRNDGRERQLDEHLARLRAGGDQVVRRPDRHVVRLPAHVVLKPGWVRLNPAEIDRMRELDGATFTERDTIHTSIEVRAPFYMPERKEEL